MDDLYAKVPNRNLIPISPMTVEETQLDFNFLVDLTLKTVYADANCSTTRIARQLCLPVPTVRLLLEHLCDEKLIQIRGQISHMDYRYAILERGWQRANRLLDLNSYIGPAPVSLQSYAAMVSQQSKDREPVLPESVQNALSNLVLPDMTLQTIGLVAKSRRTLFLFGEPGNGKTSIAMALHSAQTGEIWIPYAIEVDNQIIKMFDQHNHVQVETNGDNGYDKRWIKIKRPLVIVGGEMTIETMDLIYSPAVRYYEAPFQMKANGGTLIIDDFGRQRIDPKDLLNRWIIPLDRGMDYLTLHTGKKIEVPFNPLLIFATNLDLKGFVDEAFLRRMGYRLHIAPPTREYYISIFQRALEDNGLDYDEELVEFVLQRYKKEKRPLRCCEPRDLINNVLDICRYVGQHPELSKDLLERAWINYFGHCQSTYTRSEKKQPKRTDNQKSMHCTAETSLNAKEPATDENVPSHYVACAEISGVIRKRSDFIARSLRAAKYPVVKGGGKNYCDPEHAAELFPKWKEHLSRDFPLM